MEPKSSESGRRVESVAVSSVTVFSDWEQELIIKANSRQKYRILFFISVNDEKNIKLSSGILQADFLIKSLRLLRPSWRTRNCTAMTGLDDATTGVPLDNGQNLFCFGEPIANTTDSFNIIRVLRVIFKYFA